MQEFNKFLNANKKSPSEDLNLKVNNIVLSDICPNIWGVALKFLVMHFIVSSLTLIICPQFGIGPFGGGHGLFQFIEQYGHVVCGIFCGSIFFFCSLLLANLLLSKGEKKAISSHCYGVSLCMVFLSFFSLLIVSHMINGEIKHLHFEFVLSWFIAALVLVMLTTKIAFKNDFKFA